MKRAQLLKYWDRLEASLWFVPLLLMLGAAGLAIGALALDHGPVGRWLDAHGMAYGGSPEGASGVLETIATSMMTIAGVVFSLTLVALSLASGQFGPRLLRNFMRDTTNQVVLGTFVATFLYCIVVLLAIRRGPEAGFVPHLSVTLGVMLAVGSIGVLIYFIHHVAVHIQADEMISRVSGELVAGIERLFPEKAGRGAEGAASRADAWEPAGEPERVLARCDGYLQRVEMDDLFSTGCESDVLIRVERRPGDYVVAGTLVASVWPAGRIDRAAREAIHDSLSLGNQRTHAQDVAFDVQQLVEMALRALSPGVNEPYTAIACIDHLGSALCRLAQRRIPSPVRRDPGGRPRVIISPYSAAELVDAAFGQVALFGCGNPVVVQRLLETLALIGTFTHRDEDRAALRRTADAVFAAADARLPAAVDREPLRRRHREATAAGVPDPARAPTPAAGPVRRRA